MDFNSRMRMKKLQGQSQSLVPSHRNFYKAPAEAPPPLMWRGYTGCNTNVEIIVYTSNQTVILTIGSALYENESLTTAYTNQYFMYEGVRYKVDGGLITLIQTCDPYLI
jgi:hypothetical protein